MSGLRIVLAEDHGLVRAGLRALLEEIQDVEVAGEAADGHEALRQVARHTPHVLLLDIGLPGLNGLEVAARVTKEHPETRVVVLSMHATEEYVHRALAAGAMGYLLKDSSVPELELAIRAVQRGETYLSPAVSKVVIGGYLKRPDGDAQMRSPLTPRQRETLQLIAEGHSTKEIAHRLGLSVKTVETHRSQIMARLGVGDVAGLVRYAIQVGLVPPER